MRLGLNYPEDSMAKFTLADGTEIEAFTADEVYSDSYILRSSWPE